MANEKKGRKLSLLVCVGMLCVALVGGTFAYLTDRDSAANVFTQGNVDITLNEDFVQGSELLPGVDVEKKVTVTNNDMTEAWVWVDIAIPAVLDNATDASQNALHFNYTKESVADGQWNWKKEDGNWNMRSESINDEEYNVYTVLYQTKLASGETTETSAMSKVYLDASVDVDPDGNVCLVKNGIPSNPVWDIDENPVMHVSAYAIQAKGFDTVQEAYAAYQTQWGDKGSEWAAPGTVVETADDLIAALERNEDVILTDDIKIDPAGMSNAYGTTGINVKNGQTIDGGSHTIDIKGAGGTWDSGINTTGGIIRDVKVTGSFRGIFINHNSTHSERVVLENVVIDGTTYTISCDQGVKQGLTATNSIFNGWTSYAATLGDAKFIGCSFGEGNGYAYCRPYAPTEFVGCNFEAGFEMDARAAVTFENCTLGGEPLTADNLATLVTSNIANASVK